MPLPFKVALPTLVVITALAIFALFFKETGSGTPSLTMVANSPAPAPTQGAGQDVQERLHQLHLQRKQVLQQILDHTKKMYELGQTGQSDVLQAEIAVLRADIELCASPNKRVAIHQDIVQLYEKIEKGMRRNVADGHVNGIELARMTLIRLDAEINLAEAQLDTDAP